LSNVQFRLDTWLYYLHGIFSESSTFVFGHSAPPDRQIWPSAHNYYLDLIYNYGAIGVLMIAGLIVFTLVRINQNRKLILASPAMVGLTIVVMFLLFPDNLMKVSMRQPYSGIITFFLWGLLLARIESLRTSDKRRQSVSGDP
jgi:O-antigen ligase